MILVGLPDRESQRPELTSLDLETARKLLGHDAIIGVTCSSVEEACAAAMGGASYLGIGTMFATHT